MMTLIAFFAALLIGLAPVAPALLTIDPLAAARIAGLDAGAAPTPFRIDDGRLVAAATTRADPVALPEIWGDPDRPLVVIDPGHGGKDPGAISPIDRTQEKALALDMALALREAILERGRARVALTRETDDYVLLRDRFEIARRLGADLFISVHIDSAPNPAARGASIYTLSEVASSQEALLLARRENQSDRVAGVAIADVDEPVSAILIDLAQRDAMARSTHFAETLHRVASPSVLFRERYRLFAGLQVLKAPDLPSILFEAGYLTNAADLRLLQSRAGRQTIAAGVADAIRAYFAGRQLADTGADARPG